MSGVATAPGAYTPSVGYVAPENVAFLSVEGGGAAGMTVHPGMLHALEDLDVLRWDTRRRQVGVEGFAGSSSGSIIATLASSGYHWNEVATLLSPTAFDLIFRAESLALGDSITLGGGQRKRSVVTGAYPSPLSDPMGFALAGLMYGEASVVRYLTGPTVQGAIRRSLQRRIASITDRNPLTVPFGIGATLVDMKAEVITALKRRIAATAVVWGRDALIDEVKANYPVAVSMLLARLLDDTTWKFDDPRNLLTIMRYDYGFFAGHRWREYIDLALAFALFRSAYVEELPSIEIPDATDMRRSTSLQQMFDDEVRKAMRDPMAESAAGGPVTTDYVTLFRSYRNCTFARHRSLLYDFLSSNAPGPLAITAANLSSQESHVFSADTTPNMCIADAVRIATGLPPIFKPFIIEEGDIPSWWNVPADSTTAARPFLEGTWMDGGLFYNNPIDWYRSWESADRRVLGVGIGRPARRMIDNVTNFYWAIFDPSARVVYERNVSPTRADLRAFIPFDDHDIVFEMPTMSDQETELYRMDAWLETVNFLGGLPAVPPQQFAY